MSHELSDIAILRQLDVDMILGTITLCLFSDRRHRLDSLHRILAAGCLAREHQGIGARIDGIGDVGNLSTCGTRILNHRMQHLSGHDDRLLLLDTLTDNLTLDARDALDGYLDTQVASGNHDTIRGVDDLIDIVDTLLILYLRDDLDIAVVGIEDGLYGSHISCRAHKAVGYEVDVLIDGQHDVLAVLLRKRRQGDMHARHVDTLMRAKVTIVLYLCDDSRTVDADDEHVEGSIIEEHMVARVDVGSEV